MSDHMQLEKVMATQAFCAAPAAQPLPRASRCARGPPEFSARSATASTTRVVVITGKTSAGRPAVSIATGDGRDGRGEQHPVCESHLSGEREAAAGTAQRSGALVAAQLAALEVAVEARVQLGDGRRRDAPRA